MTLIPTVDEFACAAHGDCALAAPDVFTVEDIAVVTGDGSDDAILAGHPSITHLTERMIACTVRHMPVVPGELLEEVARLFALLSDPTRLRLLSRLHDDGELSVGALAERTGVAVANVSQHLNRLAVAGVVARRRDGKHVRYRIADPRLEQLCDLVCSGVRERAELLAG